MVFYAIASRELQRTVAFYLTQEEAEAALASVLEDDPAREPDFEVFRIDFGGAPVVDPVS
jgi:hypothetical protein